MRYLPHCSGARVDEPASVKTLLSKLCIRVGDGIKPVELGERIGVSLGSSLTNSLGVDTSHVSIYVTAILRV